jgi:WD40 repeat protein
LYLVGAFLSSWKLETAASDGMRPHDHRLRTAIANDVFASVISVDRHGGIVNWDLSRGTRNFAYSAHEPDAKLMCATLDAAQRRLALGYSNGHVSIVSAISGSELCEIDKKYLDKGCISLVFVQIYAQRRILACTGAKTVVLFEDILGNRIRFCRSFVGHTDSLGSALIIKQNMILSVGTGSELFLWSLGLPNPLLKFKLPHDPTMAMDIPGDADRFVVGDLGGFIHWMSKGLRTPLRSIDAFHMSIKSPISSLQLVDGILITSNAHGYVKLYNFSDMAELRQFRAHTDGVITLSASATHRILVTTGDESIRLWSLDPFGWIGSFGIGRLWQIDQPETWHGDEGLEADPVHFAPVERVDDGAGAHGGGEEEEGPEEDTVEARIQRMDSGLRSIPEMMELLELGEAICESGRRVLSKSKKDLESPMYPLTSGRRRTLRPAVSQGFASWINGRFEPISIKQVESQIGKPRIIRPSGSESARRQSQV